MKKKHFFVMGAQRSGTTLVATLLSQHPDVNVVIDSCVMNQFANFCLYEDCLEMNIPLPNGLCRNHIPLQYVDRDVTEGDAKRFVAVLMRHWIWSALSIDTGKNNHFTLDYIERLDVASLLTNVRNGFLRSWREVIGAVIDDLAGDVPVVGEKTPINSIRLEVIERLFPEAKIVFVVRHPFKNIGSLVKRYKDPFDRIVGDFLLYYNINIEHPDNLGFVVFDQLLQNPAGVMESLYAFLGLDNYVFNGCFQSPLHPEYVGNKLDPARNDDGAGYLDAAQRQYVLDRCRPIFERFFPEELARGA